MQIGPIEIGQPAAEGNTTMNDFFHMDIGSEMFDLIASDGFQPRGDNRKKMVTPADYVPFNLLFKVHCNGLFRPIL